MVPFPEPLPKAKLPLDVKPSRSRNGRKRRDEPDEEEDTDRWSKRDRVLADLKRAQRLQRHGLDANLVIGSGILTAMVGILWFAAAYFLGNRITIGGSVLIALGIAQVAAGARNSRY